MKMPWAGRLSAPQIGERLFLGAEADQPSATQALQALEVENSSQAGVSGIARD